MNIALIEPVGTHGGMDYYDYALCKGLKKTGNNVFFYTSNARKPVPNGLSVIESFKGIFENTPRIFKIVRWLIASWSSLTDARRRGVEIVHYHFFNLGLIQCLDVYLAKMLGFKVVATIHDVDPFHKSLNINFPKQLLESLDGVIVHNETSKQEVDNILGKHQKKKIAIIPHGHYVDFVGNKRSKRDSRRILNLPENHHIFLFFGQIKKVKGLDVAIKAVSVLRHKISNVSLLIAGKKWHDSELSYAKLIDELDLSNNIIWHSGYVPNEIVDDYYYACDAVLLPYKKIYQSGVLLMAMSYGVPVVASSLPSMQEMIKHNETGLLFAANDHNALAQEMLKITQDAIFAKQLGRRGKEYVMSSHDWTQISVQTSEFYRKIKSY